MRWCVCGLPAEEAVMLASGKGVSVVRVALLPVEQLSAGGVSFAGGGDVDVALAQPLAGAQARAGFSQHPRGILRGRRRAWDTGSHTNTHTHTNSPVMSVTKIGRAHV